jgi:hypothetical protein
MLWHILVQFLFRLAFGLAAAMACTSPRLVTAGFFRVHLWVGLGLSTFVAGIVYMLPEFRLRTAVLATAVTAALLSYIGAVIWLYERARIGRVFLWLVAAVNLIGAVLALPSDSRLGLAVADTITSGSLLGTTVTAMLLGHWYLNTPTMKLWPLQRLVLLMSAAVVVRAVVDAAVWSAGLSAVQTVDSTDYALLALRWLTGIAGVLGLAVMTWQTLKIPNTQSATGILYVAVIFAFLGELTSQLLSAETPHFV